MRSVLLCVLLVLCSTASAQKIRVHSNPDSLAVTKVAPDLKDYLQESGSAMKMSANFDLLSWGLAAISITSFAHAESKKDKTLGTVCATLAVLSKMASWGYKYKSGVQLKLAAGSISVSF